MLKKIALSLFVLCLCIVGLEAHQRSAPPSRWQRVTQFTFMNGIPVWETTGPESTGVANLACAQNESADVMILGDSILYGVMLPPKNTLGVRLSQSLKRDDESNACAVNLSIPGFTLEQEIVVAKANWNTLQPRVVVLEIWQNTPHRVIAAGSKAYNFGHLVVDHNGLPNPFHVPSWLNLSLFSNSALWIRLVEGSSKKKLGKEESMVQWRSAVEDVAAFHRWLKERNAQLVLVFATKLKHPWSEGRERERSKYRLLQDFSNKHQIPTLWFDEVLATKNVEDVRRDECCHLNSDGMALVSDSLTQVLQPLLVEPPPSENNATE